MGPALAGVHCTTRVTRLPHRHLQHFYDTAVRTLAAGCDLLLVVGSPNSSNSNRLRELAERIGTEAYLIDSEDDIQLQWLEGKAAVGITAGASAPEILVQKVVDYLQSLGATLPQEQVGTPENITFSMPKELRLPVN